MKGLQQRLEAVMKTAIRQLGSTFILGAVEWEGSNFRVWTAAGPKTSIQHMEAFAANLLQHVAGEAAGSTCSECKACRTRFERVTAALAALHEPDQMVVDTVAGPTSEAVH